MRSMETEAAIKLNFFPAKHGESKHCSSSIVFHEEHLDFKNHCIYCTGCFVHSNEDKPIKNIDSTGALDFMCLRPSADRQEWYDLLHL